MNTKPDAQYLISYYDLEPAAAPLPYWPKRRTYPRRLSSAARIDRMSRPRNAKRYHELNRRKIMLAYTYDSHTFIRDDSY